MGRAGINRCSYSLLKNPKHTNRLSVLLNWWAAHCREAAICFSKNLLFDQIYCATVCGVYCKTYILTRILTCIIITNPNTVFDCSLVPPPPKTNLKFHSNEQELGQCVIKRSGGWHKILCLQHSYFGHFFERRGGDKGTVLFVCLIPPWDYRQLFNLTSYRDRAHTYSPCSGFHI